MSSRQGAILLIVGGALAIIGTLLPWLSATAGLVGTISRSGLDIAGTDAVLVAIVGLVLAGLGLVLWNQQSRSLLGIVALAAVALGGLLLLNDYGQLSGRVENSSTAIISIGMGFYVSALGLLIGGIGGAIAVARARAARSQATGGATSPPS